MNINTKNNKTDLAWHRRNGWNGSAGEVRDAVFKFCNQYKIFLDNSKTERCAVRAVSSLAKERGFVDATNADSNTKKIILDYGGKCCALAVINDPNKFESGWLMIGSHIDSPHIDLKARPLYEAEDMAYLKGHYYGGIRKYQWLTRPLAIHGVFALAGGNKVTVNIGDEDGDPVFVINDLAPHLAKDQAKKRADEFVDGEQLNVLAGSIAEDGTGADAIKTAILRLLNAKYGVTEEDFASAELQLVPAGRARDVGLDRSFVGAAGQDNRLCAFASLQAILDTPQTKRNMMVVFFDKEEIGSFGNSGANSNLIERMVNDVLLLSGKGTYNTLIKSLENSKFLSADVCIGVDPNFPSVTERANSAKMGFGVAVMKYTGARGKSGCNEGSAEFVAEIRRAFNEDTVVWQTSEIGKVDQGGGGTIALHVARYGMDVVDCGPPVLSLHGPMEVASKIDIYQSYRAYKSFFDRL